MYTRITNQTLMRGYRREYNRILNTKNRLERKVTSTRDFNRASESPLKASKALDVRKSLYYASQYKENLKTVNKFYTEAETSLIQVSDKLASIRETIIAACNTTKNIEDYNIYAQQLETSAHELCSIFNTDSAERVIFGGSSNEPMPFEIINDSNGNASTVLYQGVPVNCLNDYNGFPYSDEVHVDIGIGMVTDQKEHYTNPDSVLVSSFNGAKVSGCGADSGIADVDLTSIKENRTYCVDVYAGDIKKTIVFVGQATPEKSVQEINKQLAFAFQKEATEDAYGNRKLEEVPFMDDQGVIAIKDKVVAIVNNTAKDPTKVATAPGSIPLKNLRTETLKVDNDAGYTDKYKINLEKLVEGKEYSVKVKVGDTEKTITFAAGKDDMTDPTNPIYREDTTLVNIQAALDKAFPDDNVVISSSALTKGIITCEGKKVKLTSVDEESKEDDSPKVGIESTTTPAVNLNNLRNGKQYAIKIGGDVYKFTYDEADTPEVALGKATSDGTNKLSDKYNISADGIITDKTTNDAVTPVAVTGSDLEVDLPAETTTALDIPLNSGKTAIDMDRLAIQLRANQNQYFAIKVGTTDITVSMNSKNYQSAIQEALDKAGLDCTFDPKTGKILDDNNDPVDLDKAADKEIELDPAKGTATSLLPTTVSQYTIDTNTLKDGVEYSLKVIYDGQVKDVKFTPDGDGDIKKLNDALKAAFGTEAGGTAKVKVEADGTIPTNANFTLGAAAVNNSANDENEMFERQTMYSKNYIQLTLDAAKALRNGDIGYANGCIDRIVSANEHLLVQIADLGCNEEYIDFNLTRITTREENLMERQNDLEIANPEQTITLWKQYEAMYNACLQMASSVIPNSIFNYMH